MTEQTQWNSILDRAGLEARFALTSSLDPRFAKEERAFYESRTPEQLRALAAQAWDCCEPTSYQMARSYAALVERIADMEALIVNGHLIVADTAKASDLVAGCRKLNAAALKLARGDG